MSDPAYILVLSGTRRGALSAAAGRRELPRCGSRRAGHCGTTGTLPLAAAGTAVLAIRSAQSSLNTLLYAVNQCYEESLYFSDYMAFCADAARRIPAPGARPAPADFDRITADAVTFTYPGSSQSALREVSIEIGRGEVVALVGPGARGHRRGAHMRENRPGLLFPDPIIVAGDGKLHGHACHRRGDHLRHHLDY